MASQFEWQDSYLLGVEVIDTAHKQLFRIINRLFEYHDKEKDSQWTCQEGIKFFKTHAVKHFDEEEAYMESIDYPGLAAHRRIHRTFRDYVLPTLEKELEQTGYAPDTVDHFLGVCAGWLIGHTLTEDQAIVGGAAPYRDAFLPGEELEALKQVIQKLQFDMFRLEAKLVSDIYGGEKFGRGIYYRLAYVNKKAASQCEVMLAFEEKLLINTVGKILGIETNHLDSMLVHASRYTAQQFVARVMKSFPGFDGYELQEENLLSYEEFQQNFRKQTQHASLLYNTGAGYLLFCLAAPHLQEKGIGTVIEADNAMEEVEKYLAERREEDEKKAGKRTVLVVDDSAAIRQNLRRMLEPDYEVLLAGSGVAAIRAIALDPPDLVLLDYEMPICDGRQTLEMLRSEQAFADIPVIFLTGHGDPESVRSVMALKPAGYLLKKLPPEKIREKIDVFFSAQQG